MEKIGDILGKMNHSSPGRGPKPTMGQPSEGCPYCKGAKWVVPALQVTDPGFGQAVPCVCLQAEWATQRYKHLLTFCEIPLVLQDRTFSAFIHRQGTKKAFEAAKALGDGTGGSHFLTLQGPPGSGKTHLGIACVLARLQANKLAKYIYVPDFLDSLRATFQDGASEQYAELIQKYKDVPLLCLDDLGAEAITPWVGEKLDQLIDYRYRTALDTVITTNLSVDKLPLRIRDRLSDTRLGRVIVLNAPSYRLQHG